MAEAPLVAICMATYEPDPRLLERQIASIREQTHERWVCLVSDDGSGAERLAHLRELIEGDARFTLSVGEGRLGFYANFERALRMVPPRAARPRAPLPGAARRPLPRPVDRRGGAGDGLDRLRRPAALRLRPARRGGARTRGGDAEL